MNGALKEEQSVRQGVLAREQLVVGNGKLEVRGVWGCMVRAERKNGIEEMRHHEIMKKKKR